MCLMDAPSPPPTPETPAPPAAPATPSDLTLKTQAKRRSDELSSMASGTRRFRNPLNKKPTPVGGSGGLSGLNIPT